MKVPVFGLETEYSVAPRHPACVAASPDAMMQWLLNRAYEDIPSVRDTSLKGVFLMNASRLYGDAGHHLEIATPELSNPWDMVRYVLAGERILQQIAADQSQAPAGWSDPLLLKTNVDYECRTTWGTHESILASRTSSLDRLAEHLTPYLVSRVLYCGAGGWNPFSPGLQFVLSPRSFFVTCGRPCSSTTHDRAIVCSRDEPLAAAHYRRLHLIVGESLNSHTAMWLRSATLALVMSLVDSGVDAGNGVVVKDPVEALRAIAADPACRVTVPVYGGPPVTALAIQRHYLAQAEAWIGSDFMPDWAAEACRQWRAMLDRLERGTEAVDATLDWAIKFRCYRDWVERRCGFDWQEVEQWTEVLTRACETLWVSAEEAPTPADAFRADSPMDPEVRHSWRELVASHGLRLDRFEPFLEVRAQMCEADVRFGQLGEDGLFARLDRAGVLDHQFPGADNIEHAMANPPASGRARVRGEIIRGLFHRRSEIACDWDAIVDAQTNQCMELPDPFAETGGVWGPRRDDRWMPSPIDWTPFNSRTSAHDAYQSGDYARAEETLRALIAEGFSLASTRCHLARVLVVQDRLDEARAELDLAWSARSRAPAYQIRRLLWFRVLFAAMDGGDVSVPLGQLKAELARGRACETWTMGPVLAHIRPRLDVPTLFLLTMLVDVLGGGRPVEQLDASDAWRDCVAVETREPT